VESLPERNALEIRWPNVLRVDTVLRPTLVLDWEALTPLVLDPATTPVVAEIAPALGGAADLDKAVRIDLELLPEEFRQPRLAFKAAAKAFAAVSHGFRGNREWLVFQLIRLVERFLESGKVEIPSLFHQDPLRRRILMALNMDLIVQHLLRHVTEQNQERLEPVFDEEIPIGSTRAMPTWYTTKPNLVTTKSQVSHVVGDSSWEGYAANLFEMHDQVSAYAKNDHLGFEIYYLWNGVRRRYVPDFLVRLANGKTLVLEIKGEDSEQNRAKRAALDAWVRAVNARGGFGVWAWDVAFEAGQIQDLIGRHAA
jgi:type III restriction enzyme